MAEVRECARDGFVIVNCESRQDDGAGQLKRWSTEMEMLVLQKLNLKYRLFL